MAARTHVEGGALSGEDIILDDADSISFRVFSVGDVCHRLCTIVAGRGA